MHFLQHLEGLAFSVTLSLVLVLFGVLPVFTRLRTRFEAAPQIVLFDPAVEPLPLSIQERSTHLHEVMAKLGFERIAGAVLPNVATNVKCICLYYAQPDSREWAHHTIVYFCLGKRTRIFQEFLAYSVDFKQHILKGLQTNNSQHWGPFPLPDYLCFTVFPHVTDLLRLYELHQRLLERHGVGVSQHARYLQEECDGDLARYIHLSQNYYYECLVGKGFLWFDAKRNCFRLTWKAAYLGIVCELWPFKGLRRRLLLARAKRLEDELLK